MTITPTTLARAAALAAVVAGLAYITIQLIHPADDVASLATQAWTGVHLLSFAEAVLALVGVTGVYLRQVRRLGVLGLVGYVLFAFFFVLQSAFNFAEALIAPLIAVSSRQLAVDFVGLFGQDPAMTDLGLLAVVPQLGGALYVVGAIVLGIAIVRARVLSRGAGILLIAAAAVTPVAGALLAHPLDRIAAVPMGLALIWLGVSLWSHPGGDSTERPSSPRENPLEPALAV
ncbi:hypothetical protein [uncultured Cellulomonas sp.]|uniref:hypothetical protein n=1 Tax=uncultured Cellulomonas sp. TaxID=189682 RepID=UPI002615A574|nr:hypothetical protein [uncultured Cellulomonas sp.]